MNKPPICVEACVTTVTSALAAQAGGAQRVELCDNLHDGGTTPGPGSITMARKYLEIKLHVIVRPRGGDFLYSDLEFEIMRDEVKRCRDEGVDGVVFGILRADGSVDLDRNARLVDLAGGMSTTFHRAFDMTADARKALRDLKQLGVERVLTSGQKPSAPAGAALIADLVRAAQDEIIILPGAGITPENAAQLVRQTGVREIHAHASVPVPSAMQYVNPHVFMGTNPELDEYAVLETTAAQFRALCAAVEGM